MKRLFLILLISFIIPSFTLANEYDGDYYYDNEYVKEITNQVAQEEYIVKGFVLYDDNPEIELDKETPKHTINLNPNIYYNDKFVIPTSNSANERSIFYQSAATTSTTDSIAPLKGYIEETAGNFTFGSTSKAVVDYAQLEYSNAIFTRYENGKIAITTTCANSNRNIGNYYTSISVAPELKLTDNLSIKNVIQTYVQITKRKNEVVLVYKPKLKKYAEAVEFELGVAQTFYKDNSRIYPGIRFATSFKL